MNLLIVKNSEKDKYHLFSFITASENVCLDMEECYTRDLEAEGWKMEMG